MNQASASVHTQDKLWNVLCHLSPFAGVGLLLPLVAYLVTKDDPASTIPDHAKETLNFHLTLLLYSVISFVLAFVLIGFLLLLALTIMATVCAIVGAIKASNEVVYRYPLTIRFVK